MPVVRMAVAPIPIGALLFLALLAEGTIIPMLLSEILAIGAVFVRIPVVVVLVVAVVYLVVVIFVLVMVFLMSIVLWPGGRDHCGWRSKGCGEKKRAEKVSIGAVHFVFLLPGDFQIGNPGY
jgi:hypothetical protein